jgi:hypothetical protein
MLTKNCQFVHAIYIIFMETKNFHPNLYQYIKYGAVVHPPTPVAPRLCTPVPDAQLEDPCPKLQRRHLGSPRPALSSGTATSAPPSIAATRAGQARALLLLRRDRPRRTTPFPPQKSGEEQAEAREGRRLDLLGTHLGMGCHRARRCMS